MNWQKMSIDRLKEYEARQSALILIPEQIKTLESNFTAIRAARTDGEPVKESSGNKREDALITNIAKRQELERNLKIAEQEAEITAQGLATLTPEERKVLYKFYINRPRRHVEELCEELNFEKTRVYEIKDIALRKFTRAVYGVVEI